MNLDAPAAVVARSSVPLAPASRTVPASFGEKRLSPSVCNNSGTPSLITGLKYSTAPAAPFSTLLTNPGSVALRIENSSGLAMNVGSDSSCDRKNEAVDFSSIIGLESINETPPL